MTKLKCWKKVGVVPNRWRKEGIIVDTSISRSDSHYSSIPAWVTSVKHERSNTYFEDKVFPSKSKALAFANKYMKSHNTC
jgi:hypothetical protein